MPEQNDIALLREFADTKSEPAFAALVERHIDLVHGVALRRTANPHAAEEITQAVFIVLARKAASLNRNVVLSGWLYHAARLTSANYLRTEMRRQRREQEAAMQFTGDEPDPWPQMAPLLEDAMATLRERDRNAIILRFFENKSMAEVGVAIGASEDATRVRVNRALEKLRKFFGRRGITLSAAAMALALSNQASPASPPALVAETSRASVQRLSSATTTAFVARTLHSLNQTNLKVAAVLAAIVTLCGILSPLLLPPRNKGNVASRPEESRRPSASTNELTRLAVTAPPSSAIREPLSATTLFTLDSPPGALVIQPDGKIIAGASLGGFFVNEESGMIGWYGRAAMRFETNGVLDRTFSSDVGRTEYTTAAGSRLALLASNRIFVSGFFHNVEGKPLHGHAILRPDGSVDESFNPWRDGETNVNHRLDYPRFTFSSALLRDGTIAVMSRPVEGTNAQAAYLWSAYRLDETGSIVWPALTNLDVARPARLILTHSDTPHGPFPELPLELIRYAVRLPEGGGILATREPPFGGARGSFKRYDQNWNVDPNFTNEFSAHRG